MLVRQATLACQKTLSSFAARAAAVGVNLRGHHGTGACSHQTPKILITGGLGQLGMPLARVFRSKYGQDSVILTDIKKPDPAVKDVGHFEFADIMDVDGLRELVVEHRIDWLIHFSALLSAVGEQNTPLAMQVNIGGLHNIFNVAREFNLRLFIPSTIGAFGPNSPRNPTPDDCIQQPNTIYGVSKVHAELLGMYLNHRYGLDFRSLRLPGVISADVEPGGGTTDYAIHIFKYAMRGEPYPCFLSQNTRLPMIWIDDVIRAMVEVMECPREKLKRCVYNLAGISFTPKEINEAMLRGMHRHGLAKQLKTYELKYDVDFRQKIADSWPEVLDDANARRDWGWRHEVDIDGMVDKMFEYLKAHSTCVQVNVAAMDYGTAFKSLTRGMDEFKAPEVKRLKKSSSSAESIDHCDYSTIPYDCTKEFLCKSPRVQKSRFPQIFSFESLLKSPYNFPPDMIDILSTLNYAKPMPVQTEVIPIFHEGHNMLVGSPTGSGKTAAYLLPILNFAACAKIGSNSQRKHTVHPYAIILSTTQELLGQIWTEAIRLGQNLFPKHGKIAILRRNHYGLRKKQSEEKKTILNKTRELRLPSDTKVLITTPKRLAMLLKKTGKQCPISFTSLRWLLIDECDKMLESNIGDNAAILRAFRSQLTAILHSIRVDATKFPNVALFSATLTPPVVAWATEELGRTDSLLSRSLVKVQLGDCNAAVSLVRQELRYCGSEQGKLLELRKMLINGLIYPCLIFTESRQRATDLFREIVLCDKLILVGILSSEKSEAQRIATVKAFREGKVNVLICTDLLGRGMDFKSLMMVVNYDLPPSPVEYIHRVGRTGRAGRAGGRAVTLWTDADLPHMDSILDVMSRSGAEVDPDLRRLVAAWKARKAKQTHARALGGVVSQRKGERKLAAKVALKKSRGEFNRERGLLRPWNPHRESITDVPGSKSRDLKIANGESVVGGGRRAKKRKRTVKNTTQVC